MAAVECLPQPLQLVDKILSLAHAVTVAATTLVTTLEDVLIVHPRKGQRCRAGNV